MSIVVEVGWITPCDVTAGPSGSKGGTVVGWVPYSLHCSGSCGSKRSRGKDVAEYNIR